MPPDKIGALKEVCRWLYGSKKENLEPIVQSQIPHLSQLDAILQNREALAALRDGSPIEIAMELTMPVPNIFSDELLKAKRSMIKAKGIVTEGYDGSESLLNIVKNISDIAYDLYFEMENKQQKHHPKRVAQI